MHGHTCLIFPMYSVTCTDYSMACLYRYTVTIGCTIIHCYMVTITVSTARHTVACSPSLRGNSAVSYCDSAHRMVCPAVSDCDSVHDSLSGCPHYNSVCMTVYHAVPYCGDQVCHTKLFCGCVHIAADRSVSCCGV